MSTFAVFGMTRDLALDDARKTVKTSRRTPLGEQPIPMTEWLALCEKTADQVMAGTKTKQLGPLFDAPQFAEQFIQVARKTLKCRDLHIKAKVTLTDEKGNPIIDKKTKAPKVGWRNYNPATEHLTA